MFILSIDKKGMGWGKKIVEIIAYMKQIYTFAE